MWTIPLILLAFTVNFYIPYKLLGLPIYLVCVFIYIACWSIDTSSRTGARSWPALRHCRLFRWIRGYFPMSVEYEDRVALLSGSQYIFAIHPHGIASLCHVFGFLVHGGQEPGCSFDIAGLTASAFFQIPTLRDFAMWFGAISTRREAVAHALSHGRSITVCPGSLDEIVHAYKNDHEENDLHIIQHRKGFIKAALVHGVPLVPVLGIGENRLYTCPEVSWTKRTRTWTAKTIGLPTPLFFWGRWGTVIPHKRPLKIVLGAPIQVDANATPSDSEITELHERFYGALAQLAVRHNIVLDEIKLPV